MAKKNSHHSRIQIMFCTIITGFLLVTVRLYYWQVINAKSSQSAIFQQSTNTITLRGKRGKIFAAQGELLVGNQSAWDIYLNKNELDISKEELFNKLVELYGSLQDLDDLDQDHFFQTNLEEFSLSLNQSIDRDTNWIKIFDTVPEEFKNEIIDLNIAGIHPFEVEVRYYPEGSMAAHLTGFVGKTQDNEPIGYFGVEGALNKELEGQTKIISYKKDAKGNFLADQEYEPYKLDGRDITLTIHRDIQFLVEKVLAEGIEQYHSQSGEIVVMDPKTGAVLALATWPHYQQAIYQQFNTQEYKNPALASLYEPGSTFKVITVATGIDLGVITPDTECTKCAGPRTIGRYTINTWNKEFNPNITMFEALRKSDNTAMVFVSEKIGANRFTEYIKRFGISESLSLDLQEDKNTPFPQRIGPIELATISFGQGISTNTMQLTRALCVIAYNGIMMKPYIVSSVYDSQTDELIQYEPQEQRAVIKPETAQTVTQMMIHSAPSRNNWINTNYLVAGKSGTSQIPSEAGGYKDSGTIASFVGFAPADDPKFVMTVKLTEPLVDQWGATTAVPIWYEIADKLILML